MAWTGLALTVEGQNALNKAQTANRMNIKSIVIGDGAAPANFRTQKALVHQLYEITDLKVDLKNGTCTLTADIPQIEYDYYFREMGVVVVTDEGEKLYAYDNCSDSAQYIVSTTGVESTRKRIRLVLIISDVAEITVAESGILYVDYDDYEKTIEEIMNTARTDKEDLEKEIKEVSKKVTEYTDEKYQQVTEETNEKINNLHIENKVDKVAGKGLSTNDYTTKEKEKLSGIADGAEVNVQPDWDVADTNSDAYIKNKPQSLPASDVPDWAKQPYKPQYTQSEVGLGNVNNTSDASKPVSTAQQTAIDEAYQQATAYADRIVAALINGAPNTLDTLGEIAKAMKDNEDVVKALDAAIGTKADQAELDGHTKNGIIHITSTERTNWNDANNKKHSHSNKSVLDAITSAIVDGWNSAVNHISDSVKHITAAERKKWNEGSVNMTAATATAAGKAGLVPTPPAGAQEKYLTGAGTFENVDDHVATFTSADVADGSATAWTAVAKLASGETHKSIFNKVSTMFKNVRYLYKMLGNTDISAIGGGTVTGAINALNTDLDKLGGHSLHYSAISYIGNITTMSNLLVSLNRCICTLSTEDISDKPTGKYGTILIIKYSNTRASAICLCTDGSMFINSWNASTSTITGWKEK